MTDEARMIGYGLLKTGTLVSFRIVEQEVLSAADEAEFGLQLQLKFVPDEGEDDLDEDDAAEDTAEWGALAFLFVLGVLSFADAKPREASVLDYVETDEFKLADFIERLREVRGRSAEPSRQHSTSLKVATRIPCRTLSQSLNGEHGSTSRPVIDYTDALPKAFFYERLRPSLLHCTHVRLHWRSSEKSLVMNQLDRRVSIAPMMDWSD